VFSLSVPRIITPINFKSIHPSKSKNMKSLFQLGLLALGLVLTGCGPKDMGRVSGTVTLDGKPLPDAVIQFQPTNGERPSAAATDSAGRYELMYATTTKGARVGEHAVTISTYSEFKVDEETGNRSPGSPELLPAKYNIKSELKKTVEAGNNTIDFELDSKGEIPKRARTPGY
jgi:hypothetical protein